MTGSNTSPNSEATMSRSIRKVGVEKRPLYAGSTLLLNVYDDSQVSTAPHKFRTSREHLRQVSFKLVGLVVTPVVSLGGRQRATKIHLHERSSAGNRRSKREKLTLRVRLEISVSIPSLRDTPVKPMENRLFPPPQLRTAENQGRRLRWRADVGFVGGKEDDVLLVTFCVNHGPGQTLRMYILLWHWCMTRALCWEIDEIKGEGLTEIATLFQWSRDIQIKGTDRKESRFLVRLPLWLVDTGNMKKTPVLIMIFRQGGRNWSQLRAENLLLPCGGTLVVQPSYPLNAQAIAPDERSPIQYWNWRRVALMGSLEVVNQAPPFLSSFVTDIVMLSMF
ncbi:hypothetical protein EV421DRAFT_1971355 [Armillaria borealis]|uniref:Uncharacterized protein n=1 Tax=Armillaria borealis TaxID=47425 RepID=A0AA39JD08_9AGAR|nr:hypothetical protein EV421DRAFT_1971355 [Armillaria borealis]